MTDDSGRRGSSAEEPQLSLDGVFDLLGNRHRRDLLLFLHRRSEQTFRLSEAVSRLAGDEPVRPSDNESRDAVETRLRHVHLPKLRDAGVVTDAESEDAFRYRPDERLATWLEYVEAETAPDEAA